MKRKGLCITCANNEACIFPEKLPVWQCEEFSNLRTIKKREKKSKKNPMLSEK